VGHLLDHRKKVSEEGRKRGSGRMQGWGGKRNGCNKFARNSTAQEAPAETAKPQEEKKKENTAGKARPYP